MSGAIALAAIVVMMALVAVALLGTMVRSIRDECRKGEARAWRDFGLSIALAILFFASWAGQGVAQWQEFTDQQRSHNEPVRVGDFVADFSEATFENWQSEFLQLFSFVVLSALLIHRGSAESKDSDDRMEQSLKRIEDRLERLEGTARNP